MSNNGYDGAGAALYASLGITGTTYEASARAASEMLGDLNGLKCLDFGCGAGRSSLLLSSLGPAEVVGVDRNDSMLSVAATAHNVTYRSINNTIPYPDEYFDVILASHVFMESRSEQELRDAHREIVRCLAKDGRFVAINMNPDSLGAKWLTFSYEPNPTVVSGEEVMCTVRTPEGELRIPDIWWSQVDYERITRECGLRIQERILPLASGSGWLDETVVAPDAVYEFRKIQS